MRRIEDDRRDGERALERLAHADAEYVVRVRVAQHGEARAEIVRRDELALAAREGWHTTALVRPGTEHLVSAATVITALQGRYDAVLDTAALNGPALAAVADGGRYVGFKPGDPQTPERGIAVSTVQVRPDGEGLAALLPLAAEGVVPVRIAGTAALVDAAAAYERGSSESGSRGRWLLVP